MTDLVGAVVSSAVIAFVAGFALRPVADGVMRVQRQRKAKDAAPGVVPFDAKKRKLLGSLALSNQGIRTEDRS